MASGGQCKHFSGVKVPIDEKGYPTNVLKEAA